MSTSSAPKPRSLDPLIGATLLDRYRIEKIIGRGGQGLVYLAEQLDAKRMVVLKLLAPQWLDDDTAVTRFAREGKRLQQLAHVNVVQMLECGHHAEQFFIAMEYLDGEPLRRFLGRRGRLSLQEFTPIAAQILGAVGYAHDRNIMLRDIKPANIMLCEKDGKANFVKLLDFGLAKLVDGDAEEVTKSHVIGTAGYLAPEQIKGEPVDLRVDVYAIGVLFYLMLAGESPIVGENDGALLYNHVHGTPKPLGEHLPEGHNVPELLIALVHQCLEKDPARRPADANEVAEALFECVPPKLFTLPTADDESRRAMREYRDARDRGLEHDGPVSSEWTKPVLRAALEGAKPAELSSASLPQPRTVRRPSSPGVPTAVADRAGSRSAVPTPVSDRTGSRASMPKPPQPPRRGTPPPIPAPPKGRAAAIAGRSGDAALRTDDGVVRSDAPDARAADGAVTRGAPNVARRPTPPLPRARSQPEAAAPAIVATAASTEIVVDAGSTQPAGPTELGAVLAIPDTGRMPRESGPLAVSRALPVKRRVLVAIGALALAAGALAAWAIFIPAGDAAKNGAVAAAATTTGATKAGASPSSSSSGDRAPGESVASSKGAIEVRAIEGARIEIDGVEVGVAPRRIELGVGSHEVRIVAPGYAPWTETIEIGSGDNPAIEARMSADVAAVGAAKSDRGAGAGATAKTGAGTKKKGKGARADDLPPPPSIDEDEPASSDDDDEVIDTPLLPDKPDPVAPQPRKPPPPPPAPDPKKQDDPFLPTTPTPSSDPLLPSE
ncbi:MAG TPA: protein kinase [Nannocystaceae bacterium]|nr:protein kinase [Nannocystaceae bacterium]